MSIGLRGIVAKALENIDADLLLLAKFFMRLKARQKLRQHILAMMLHRNVPRLVVDTCTGDVQLLSRDAEHLRDLHLAVDLSVAQTNGLYLSIFIAGPGRHRIRIRIVQHDRTRLCHLADILAEVKQRRDDALSVHDTARAKRIAHALVHAILQRNLHILLKALKSTDPDTVYDITRIFKCLSAICSRLNRHRNPIRIQIPLAERARPLQIRRIDVCKCDFNIPKLRYRHNVRK